MEALRQGRRKLVTESNKYKPIGFCNVGDSGNWYKMNFESLAHIHFHTSTSVPISTIFTGIGP
jgi:hypothetical protein